MEVGFSMSDHFKVFEGAKVLVTGHCGFKGSWLTQWLTQLGAEVCGFSLEVPTTPSMFDSMVKGNSLIDLRGNVCDQAAIFDALKKFRPDFVFHLAAQPIVKLSYVDPILTWQSNVMGTVRVLEALRQVDKECVAVFITSDKAYDNVEWVWGYRETDALGGPDPYSASKGAAELAIRSYVRSFFPKDGVVKVGVGRAGNVIGGGDWAADRIIPDCVRSWSAGDSVKLRRPNATRPWQHVLEPLSGYLALAAALKCGSELHGEAFNFGPNLDENYTVSQVVADMAGHWSGAEWEDISAGETTSVYESHLLKLNCDKALYHLSWCASMDYEQTVRMTIAWYLEFYKNKPDNMREFTNRQISEYTAIAAGRGVPWA